MSQSGLGWWCHSVLLTGGGGGSKMGAGLGGIEEWPTEVGGGVNICGSNFLKNFLFLFVTVLEPSTLTI